MDSFASFVYGLHVVLGPPPFWYPQTNGIEILVSPVFYIITKMLILNFVEALFCKIKYLMSTYGILETLQSYYNCNVFTGRTHEFVEQAHVHCLFE